VEERGGGAPPSALFQWHAFVATQSVDPFGAEIGALQNASEPVDRIDTARRRSCRLGRSISRRHVHDAISEPRKLFKFLTRDYRIRGVHSASSPDERRASGFIVDIVGASSSLFFPETGKAYPMMAFVTSRSDSGVRP